MLKKNGFNSLVFVILYLFFFSKVIAETNKKELPKNQQGRNLTDCVSKLNSQNGGWCEIRVKGDKPSISSVWPKSIPSRTRMVVGPKSILIAWNSAGFDEKREIMYFTGGGHADYGGNEVYQFDLKKGKWTRLTDPSPLNYMYSEPMNQQNTSTRRLCWMPDVRNVPASSHTYDGLQFSKKTDTLFYFVMRAANGSCFVEKVGQHIDSSLVLGERTKTSAGWYEFNPSMTENRNDLPPLSWRKVFDYDQLKSASLLNMYPMTAELSDGSIVFGSKIRTVIYDPTIPQARTLVRYTNQADWGDGSKIYDKKRDLIWSINGRSLLAFDAKTGKQIQVIEANVNHGSSLAIDKSGNLVFWNGSTGIFTVNPDEKNPKWRMIDWKSNGPKFGYGRVYGKWVYLNRHDVFAGISNEKTGVWIYKQPKEIKTIVFSSINPQKIINSSKPNSTVTIPSGTYGRGLIINKSMTVKMSGVELRGRVGSKGIINVSCTNCNVIIEDFHGNGQISGCITGNCSGIKAEGENFNLIIRRGHIENTVMGILTDNRKGTLTIDDSLIENTGINNRRYGNKTLGHAVYAGKIDKLTIRNSKIRRTFGNGHIIKSRAPNTLIENSIIAGEDGYQSRTIDFPCGGKLTIHNSTLQHSENADNVDLISVGTEPSACQNEIHSSEVSVKNNWIIFDRDRSSEERSKNAGPNVFFNWRAPLISINVSGNRIVNSAENLKFEFTDNLPEMLENNQIFNSRKAAGLGKNEIPPAPNW